MKILGNILRFLISLGLIFTLITYYSISYSTSPFGTSYVIDFIVGIFLVIALTIGMSKFITFGFEKKNKKN